MVIFSFTVANSVIILRFAIPVTKKLNQNNLLKPNNNILHRYKSNLAIQLLILFAVTLIFYIFFLDSYFISLMVGYAFACISLLGKYKDLGLTITNLAEYLEMNKETLQDEIVQKCDGDGALIFKYVSKFL